MDDDTKGQHSRHTGKQGMRGIREVVNTESDESLLRCVEMMREQQIRAGLERIRDYRGRGSTSQVTAEPPQLRVESQ